MLKCNVAACALKILGVSHGKWLAIPEGFGGVRPKPLQSCSPLKESSFRTVIHFVLPLQSFAIVARGK